MPHGVPGHRLVITDETGGFQKVLAGRGGHGMFIPGFDHQLVPDVAELVFAEDAGDERHSGGEVFLASAGEGGQSHALLLDEEDRPARLDDKPVADAAKEWTRAPFEER